MESQFICPECGHHHSEPADARLGHVLTCLECAIADGGFAVEFESPCESLAA